MAQHTLVLMRHGKSDWSGLEPDHERPLGKRGRRQAPEAGAWLAGHVHVDLAVVSTAERARETWELVSGELPEPPDVRFDERVYGATAAHLLEIVHGFPEEAGTVVVVGHNPDLEDLVAQLTGAWVALKTSSVAILDLDVPWPQVRSATLRETHRID